MKLPLIEVRLPLLNRCYKGTSRSGHGRKTRGLKKAINRLLFYTLEFTKLGGAQPLEVDLTVRGRPVTLKLNPFNRQFSPFYFHAFKDGYEVTVARSIRHFLPSDGVFVDVGSNWGYFPLLLASQEVFHGNIFAFEPVPSTYKDLRSVIEQAGLRDWVQSFEMAVGAEGGAVTMNLPRHSGLASIDAEGAGKFKVSVTTLDSFQWERVDVIKVDVEGFEVAVFEGAVETLKRCRPMVVFENGVGEGEDTINPLTFLEGQGYQLHFPSIKGDLVEFEAFRANDRAGLPGYFNVVAVHSSKLVGNPDAGE